MPFRFDPGIFSVEGLAGEVLPGTRLFWYASGTSTPLATYADPDLGVANTNPVLSAADGRLPPIWLQDANYKLVVGLPDGTIITRDPIRNPGSGVFPSFDELSASDGSNLIGFKQTGTGAITRSIADALSETLSVAGYGNGIDGAAVELCKTACITQGKIMRIPARAYSFTQGIDFSGLKGIQLDGDVEFDFTGITNPANVPGIGYVNAIGGALIPLPNLSVDTVAGATQITLVSPPMILTAGDWVNLYNSTPSSFSGFKADYTDGQWAQVAEVSGDVVKFYTTILRAYSASAMQIYKHPGSRFSISGTGSLTIRESQVNNSGLNSKAGFYAARYISPDFSKIRPTQADYGAMFLRQVIGLVGSGYNVRQSSKRVAGANYGLAMVGCQDGNIEGNFYGHNHSITVGGGGEAGDVPTRFIKARGNFANHPASTIGSANMHGHCEFIHYDGYFDGGFSGGGDYLKVSGTVRQRGDACPLYFNELRGANIDLSGLTVETQGNPQAIGSGIIDIGANAINALNAMSVNGGLINLRGMVINAPNAKRGLFIRNRGCVQPVHIDITGMTAIIASDGLHIIDVLSGIPFETLRMAYAQLGTTALGNLSGFDTITGWRYNTTITLNPLTDSSSVGQSVPFQTPGNKIPRVSAQVNNLTTSLTVGGKRVVPVVRSLSAASAVVHVQTCDGANFATTDPATVNVNVTL